MEIKMSDIDEIIKKNNIQQVTTPIIFKNGNQPTDDGLLSYRIFGTTSYERRNLMGYINLGAKFMQPYVYRVWASMDQNIKRIVHGQGSFILDENNHIRTAIDGNGETGIDFIIKNIDKIKIRSTGVKDRDSKIQFIYDHKKTMFIDKYLVIPAFFRDVNTDKSFIGVGEINELYIKLMNASKAVEDLAGFGFSTGNAAKGKVQETLLDIYSMLTDEPSVRGKHGAIRKSVMSKTTDYATRLIIAAPSIDFDRPEDMFVTLDYSAVPLYSLCANFFGFILFYCRRFFENEFSSGMYPYINNKGILEYDKVKDPSVNFSDDVITKQINNFINGVSNRFTPISIPLENGKKISMRFKGRRVANENVKDPGNSPLLERSFTWCDLFFMAADEMTKDKHIMITRFPLEDHFGQFPTKITVSSTIKTEPMFVGNKVYRNYPYIREKDINKDTSNDFIDVLMISNLHLNPIGGDYDGDMCTIKGIYSTEANKELDAHINSLTNYIGLDGTNVRTSSNEAVQAIYNLTLVLPGTSLTDPKF